MMSGKCIFCRSRLYATMSGDLHGKATLEHIVPRSKGGTNDPSNLAIACKGCNNEKGRNQDKLGKNDPRYLKRVQYLLEQKEKRAK